MILREHVFWGFDKSLSWYCSNLRHENLVIDSLCLQEIPVETSCNTMYIYLPWPRCQYPLQDAQDSHVCCIGQVRT